MSIPQPIISLRPTDVTIPSSLDEILPEVDILRKLQEAEKKIDTYTITKWFELQELTAKPQIEHLVLRVFIYNYCENQPWQIDLIQDPKLRQQFENLKPSWTLRVEGRVIDNEKNDDIKKRRYFSSLLTGIAIDLFPKDEKSFTEQNDNKSLIIEWHEDVKKVDFDGLDVQRNGSQNMNCTITLQPKEFPLRYKLPDKLIEILGYDELNQHDLAFALWQYISINDLASNANDKKFIKCDEPLKDLLNCDSIQFPQLLQNIEKLLKPVDPIKISYQIRCDKSSTLGENVYDIDISLPKPQSDLQSELGKEFLESRKIFGMYEDDIKELDNKIMLGTQALNQSKLKYDFYKKFSEDPINFFKNFLESHSKALRILCGDEGYTEENVRRSDFYTDELLSDNIDLLLQTKNL
ncbi:Rsc6p ASCRUDRAFT_39055 [Ascoidea rubescens DSM 1968]|uniref:DM2 domain-containing protein n=1 Tax=Ascoidea rubescens DSM 1968 TaxID=1344418 RepID=A0A1D2VA99_9ASCO|nr:hypothetical protein ASCRUDRAFT_39055 [Ascoidea rubescens DSM 1968]ODV58519.1 hypothetical protein ASCRUDRAFT_39055 [Ascoidea rubescens DSM 1968]